MRGLGVAWLGTEEVFLTKKEERFGGISMTRTRYFL